MPIPYNDLDNLILSQFSSAMVTPDDKPNTGDCTPAEYADLQTSELLTTTDGADAVGTDLSVTTVPDTVVLVSALQRGFMRKILNIKTIKYFIEFFRPFVVLIFIQGVKIFTVVYYSSEVNRNMSTEQQKIYDAIDSLDFAESPVELPCNVTTLSQELAELERKRIQWALQTANNNKTHASKRLGIGRTLLIHKCKKYGLAV